MLNKRIWVILLGVILAGFVLSTSTVYADVGSWSVIGGDGGSGLGYFSYPYGVAIDVNGNIYVADSNNNRIQKLSIGTNTWSEWTKIGGGRGSGLGEFNRPSAVAIDNNGNIYVADLGNNRIQKLNVDTNTWNEWKKPGGESGSGLGEFNCPTGIAVDEKGNVYVADYSNNRIQKLNIDTNTWSEWGKTGGGSGSALGEFNCPVGVAVDKKGNVYVADEGNNRIQKLNIDTNTWSGLGKAIDGYGSGLGEFNQPNGVALDNKGNVYVVDIGNNRIQKLNIDTNTWSELAIPCRGYNSYPSGIAVDGVGNVFVTDISISRIQEFKVVNNSSINPTMFSFDKISLSQSDVCITMALNTNSLVGIENNEATLVPGTDYTVSGNVVTIKKEYLKAQPNGVTSLTFRFSAGITQTLKIKVTNTNFSKIQITGAGTIQISSNQALTSKYSAKVFDGNNSLITNRDIVWSIDDINPPTGIDIDSKSGLLNINSNASPGRFSIKAQCDNTIEKKFITITKDPVKLSGIEVNMLPTNNPFSSGVYLSVSAQGKDQFGNDMDLSQVNWKCVDNNIETTFGGTSNTQTIYLGSRSNSYVVLIKATSGDITGTYKVSVPGESAYGEPAYPAIINIVGNSDFALLGKDKGYETYTAYVANQYGEPMTNERVIWSIAETNLAGVSVDSSTGRVTVTNQVKVNAFILRASVGNYFKDLKINIYPQAIKDNASIWDTQTTDFEIRLCPNFWDPVAIQVGRYGPDPTTITDTPGDGIFDDVNMWFVKRNDGTYYCSYSTPVSSYEMHEFKPCKSGLIIIKVYSKERVSNKDTCGMNLIIHNETDLAVHLFSLNDDKLNPRFKIKEVEGRLILHNSDDMNYLKDGTMGEIPVSFTDNTNILADSNKNSLLSTDNIGFVSENRMLATESNDNIVSVKNIADGAVQYKIGTGSGSYVEFSPDGKYIFSISNDKQTARIINASDGKIIYTLAGHTDKINSGAFSPDGKYILTASDDYTVKLWKVDDGTLEKTFTGHTKKVNWVAFSPDSQFAVSCADDKSVKVWKISDGSIINSIDMSASSSIPNCVSYTPDGKNIGVSLNNQVIFYNANDFKLIRTIGENNGIYAYNKVVKFSPDGKYLAFIYANKISIYTLSDGALLRDLGINSYKGISLAAFSPDSQYIIYGDSNGNSIADRIDISKISDGSLVKKISQSYSYINCVSYSPDGQFIVVGSDKGISEYKTSDYTALPGIGVLDGIKFSLDGKKLIGNVNRSMSVFDGETGLLLQTFPNDIVYDAGFSDDSSVVGVDESTYVKFFKLDDGSTLGKIYDDINSPIAISPNNQIVAYNIYGQSYDISLKNISNGSIVRRIPCSKYVKYLKFSGDGNKLAAGLADNSLIIFNVSDGSKIKTMNFSNPIVSVLFGRDGNTIVCLTKTDNPLVIKLDDPNKLHTLLGDANGTRAMTFTSDEQYIYTIGANNTKKWDLTKLFNNTDVTNYGKCEIKNLEDKSQYFIGQVIPIKISTNMENNIKKISFFVNDVLFETYSPDTCNGVFNNQWIFTNSMELSKSFALTLDRWKLGKNILRFEVEDNSGKINSSNEISFDLYKMDIDKDNINMYLADTSITIAVSGLPDNFDYGEIKWAKITQTAFNMNSGDIDFIGTGPNVIIIPKKEGSVILSGYIDGAPQYKKSVVINILKAVTDIKTDISTLNIDEGGPDGVVNYTVTPSDAYNKNIRCLSSDENIAVVSSNLLKFNDSGWHNQISITPKAIGNAVISLITENGNKIATVNVTVNPHVAVSSIKLNKNILAMHIGDSFQLTAVVNPSNAAIKNVVWSSDNPKEISVDENGQVLAVNSGVATITAKSMDGNIIDSCYVTVNTSVSGFMLNRGALNIEVNKTAKLEAIIIPYNANNKKIYWSSDDIKIATVDEEGNVSGVKPGLAIITARTEDGGFISKSSITVAYAKGAVTCITVTGAGFATEITTLGGGLQMTADILPMDATDPSVKWSVTEIDGTSATSKATISADGMLTAVENGIVRVKATSISNGTVYGILDITITNNPVAVLGVSLNKASITITAGQAEQLVETVSPENATNKGVTWSVASGSNLVSVTQTGQVTAVAPGMAVIRVASVEDSTKYAECTVYIKELIGDLNRDNAITFEDATIMKNYLLGKVSGDSSNALSNGDMDGDGRITSKDYALLLREIRKYK